MGSVRCDIRWVWRAAIWASPETTLLFLNELETPRLWSWLLNDDVKVGRQLWSDIMPGQFHASNSHNLLPLLVALCTTQQSLSAPKSQHFFPRGYRGALLRMAQHLKPQQCATKLCRLKRWQLLCCSRGRMIHIDGSAVKVSKSKWRDEETCRHDGGFFYDAQFSLTMFSNNNLCIFRRNSLFLFSKGLDLSSREGQRPAKANPNSQRKFSAFQNPNSKAESVLCGFIRNSNFYLNEKA